MTPTEPLAWTLITGASAGIGKALCETFAARGHALILVSRNAEKLQVLAKDLQRSYEVDCRVMPCDLSLPGAASQLHQQTEAAGLAVEVLVNNAGLLVEGEFLAADCERHLELLQVNITACTELAHRYLGPMKQRGYGRLLNVASTSSFQPVPLLASYAASKAYLLSLSEALWLETRGTGVSVTALCPGFTNTDMIVKDGGGAMHLPLVPNMEADEVARQAYQACMSGKPVHVCGLANTAAVEAGRFQPRWLRRRLSLMLARSGF